jgi:RimJ/RimL family protein N-acetyltransferase
MTGADANTTFATERLRVRALVADDEKLYCDLYTDPRLMRHIGPVLDGPKVRRSFQAAVAAAARRPPRHIYFGLLKGSDGDSVGVCALRDIDPAQHCAEIGLMIRREAHATGLAREGLDAVAAWAFSALQLERIYGRADPSNHAACRVARRAGFSLVGGHVGGTTPSAHLFVRHRSVPVPSTNH